MTNTQIELYEVGGIVRDDLLGIRSNDVDYSVVAESFEAILEWLEQEGFKVWLVTEEFYTIRAQFPVGAQGFGGRDVAGLSADFVWARREGPYSDGRRPDWVQSGTLLDDLSRRDYSINAMAKDSEGNLIDPFGGQEDLSNRVLRAVGSAEDRLREDPLRALRALRFMVTKNLIWDDDLHIAMRSEWLPELVAAVSEDRRRDELNKMLKFSTLKTLYALDSYTSYELNDAIFSGTLRLEATSKK